MRKRVKGDLAAGIVKQIAHSATFEYECLTRNLIARFRGNVAACPEFHRLGHEIYAWLRASDPQLPDNDSYSGWLRVLQQITRFCPAAGFELVPPGFPILPYGSSSAIGLPDRTDVFYDEYRYERSPFELSCSALQMFIEPYETRFLRSSSRIHLVPWQLACVFANPRVMMLDPGEIALTGLKDAIALVGCREPSRSPRFFRGAKWSGRLVLGGRELIRLYAGSKNMCSVLEEFEETGWPSDIETPQSLGLVLEHAARDVVTKLNSRQKGSPRIKFTPVDSGHRIRHTVVMGDERQAALNAVPQQAVSHQLSQACDTPREQVPGCAGGA